VILLLSIAFGDQNFSLIST